MVTKAFDPDERWASWKIFLPTGDDCVISAIDVSRGILQSLSRSYRHVCSDLVLGTEKKRPSQAGIGLGKNGCSYLVLSAKALEALPSEQLAHAQSVVVVGGHHDFRLRQFLKVKRLYGIPYSMPRVWVDLSSPSSRRTALAFHRPGRFSVRVLVSALRAWSLVSHRLPVRGRKVTIYSRTHVTSFLDEQVDQIFHEPMRFCSAYSGSCDPTRKITAFVRLQSGTDVIAKVADTDEGRAAVQKEARALIWLRTNTSLGVNVPALIGAAVVGNGCLTQFQTVLPCGRYSKQFMDLHEHFLNEIYRASRRSMALRDVPLFTRCQKELTQGEHASISSVVRYLSRRSDLAVEVSFSHGDFTPWNCAIDERRLVVYDWEDAENLVPAGYDVFCYLYMQAVLIGPWAGLRGILREWEPRVSGAISAQGALYFALYLLNQHLRRSQVDNEVWLDLLCLLNKETCAAP